MFFLLSISVGTTWQKQAHSFLGRRGKSIVRVLLSPRQEDVYDFCAFPFICQGFRNDGNSLQDMTEYLNQSKNRNQKYPTEQKHPEVDVGDLNASSFLFFLYSLSIF